MTRWLLDTNILSELRRPKPEPKVLAHIAAQPLEQLYVSAVTFAEIRFGIELVADAGRRAELNDWVEHKIRPMFDERVLAISEDVMFKWRLLVEEGRKAYLLTAGSHHRGHSAVPRIDHPFTGHERLRARPRTGPQSMAVMPSLLRSTRSYPFTTIRTKRIFTNDLRLA